MGSIEGSPHHSRPHELTFSDRTESESTIKSPFYRPLTPSCLTTLQSCSEPLEYITSPDMSSATKEVAAIEVPAHTRGSSDTLGEIRSDHFDTSTIDSFDTRYVMRSKEKQTLRKSAVDLVCDPLMSSSDNDCKNNLNRNSDTDENKSSLDMASKIDNGIMISEDSDDEGGEFSSTDIDTSSMGSSPCKHIIGELTFNSSYLSSIYVYSIYASLSAAPSAMMINYNYPLIWLLTYISQKLFKTFEFAENKSHQKSDKFFLHIRA